MNDLVSNMYFLNEKGKLTRKPFQCGIIVSIRSTLALYQELKDENVQYVLTTRLNQDCLENLFSLLRFLGGHGAHPTPIQVMDRIRKICLTKSVNIVLDQANVEQSDQDQFITAEIVGQMDGLNIIDHKKSPLYSIGNEESRKASNIQARNYVVGFIGKKLGLKQRRNPAPSTWITLKGDGKLFHPSESLVEMCEVCEQKSFMEMD